MFIKWTHDGEYVNPATVRKIIITEDKVFLFFIGAYDIEYSYDTNQHYGVDGLAEAYAYNELVEDAVQWLVQSGFVLPDIVKEGIS